VEEVVYGCSCGEEFGVGEDFEGEVWAVDFELEKVELAANFEEGEVGRTVS
jgi:hypothetical protein